MPADSSRAVVAPHPPERRDDDGWPQKVPRGCLRVDAGSAGRVAVYERRRVLRRRAAFAALVAGVLGAAWYGWLLLRTEASAEADPDVVRWLRAPWIEWED